MAQRIIRYAKLVGPENVIAGRDCGFGTSARTNPAIEPEIVWAKPQAVTEAARVATEDLS